MQERYFKKGKHTLFESDPTNEKIVISPSKKTKYCVKPNKDNPGSLDLQNLFAKYHGCSSDQAPEAFEQFTHFIQLFVAKLIRKLNPDLTPSAAILYKSDEYYIGSKHLGVDMEERCFGQ